MGEEMCSSIEGGLWGCIVVFAAFFIQVLAFGTSQSIGLYNIEFLRHFDEGAAAVSLVGSINLGVFLGAGPLASVMMSRWSHRQVALIGAGLSNVGLIFMPFAPNLLYMYVFYGLVTGLGYSLVYVPSHILSGLYFSKHQSLATGIATAGSGMGATLFPIFMHYIIQYYGWRGSMYLLAGLNLHLLVFAALLRPVPKDLKAALLRAEKLKQFKESHRNQKPDDCLTHEYEVEIGLEKITEVITTSNGNNISVQVVEADSDVTCKMITTNETPINEEKEMTVCQSLIKHFKTLFHLDFIIYCISNILWNAGGGVILIFFAEYSVSVGMDKKDASLFLTLCGAGSCFGCVLGGLLGNIKHFNRITIYILGTVGAGLSTILLTWKTVHTVAGFAVIITIFGLMFGVILGLLVVVTSDLLGMDALGDGFGYLMFANGIGIFCGPPVAGLLIDVFHDLDPAMYFSGGLTIMGGVVMCLVPIRRRLCGKKT